jgi:phosphatidylethanolamine-binding protein (PEBP) family uncharacterized protein
MQDVSRPAEALPCARAAFRSLPFGCLLWYHHYVFEPYALSKTLDLPADATRAQLLDAMKDVIVGRAAYVGRFRQ